MNQKTVKKINRIFGIGSQRAHLAKKTYNSLNRNERVEVNKRMKTYLFTENKEELLGVQNLLNI